MFHPWINLDMCISIICISSPNVRSIRTNNFHSVCVSSHPYLYEKHLTHIVMTWIKVWSTWYPIVSPQVKFTYGDFFWWICFSASCIFNVLLRVEAHDFDVQTPFLLFRKVFCDQVSTYGTCCSTIVDTVLLQWCLW